MKAPIKYFGGKGTMSKTIISHFPKTDSYSIYVEPFGGSFSVGLAVPHPAPIQIYNDLEQNVFSLYKVLSDVELFPRFKEKCDLAIYSEDFRKEYKELLKLESLSIVDRAFYFFYVNRTSHNGIGGFSTNCYIRRKMSKSCSDFLSVIDRLPELHQRLSSVIIRNTDGIKLISEYSSENVMIYVDAPYHQDTRTTARYKIDMDNKTQTSLIDVLIENKSKILVSGYDCDEYRRLETEGNFQKVSFIVNTISGNFEKKQKTECLWKNYTI